MTSPNGAGSTGERVLVVDDEADIVALVAYHLVKAGYRVSTASTGPDALVAARQERPALIVLDLMLPGASGYDVLDQLRANAATRDIAVLMLTARREEQDRIRGLTLGADDYLTKPFSPPELVLRVGAILRRLSAGGVGPADVLTVGPITIDRAEHRVSVENRKPFPMQDSCGLARNGPRVEVTPAMWLKASVRGHLLVVRTQHRWRRRRRARGVLLSHEGDRT